MPQSLACVLVHIVFSTKNRVRWIAPDVEADFNFLLTTLGLTKGNLATHVGKLEAAGYVEVSKEFRGKIPHTGYQLTADGRREFDNYWENMNGLAPGQWQANAAEGQGEV